jgi:conjugal transfer pilin signal peptidase TrbI
MKKIIALYSLFIILMVSLVCFTEIQINRSPSLSHSVFLVVKGMGVNKGDLVSIKGHQTKYFKDLNFTKRIVGIKGETVPCGATLKSKTKHGKPLTELCTHVIPDGFVYVKADHPDSFDSRYQEFGLVKTDHIMGRAFPLW